MAEKIYKPILDDQARRACLLGLTNLELATFFEVSPTTIDNWLERYDSFREAVHDGREHADGHVAASMYERACGYSHEAVKIVVVNGVVRKVRYTEHYPPSEAAGKFWLTNRQPKRWKDVSTKELTGANGGPMVNVIADDPIEAARAYQQIMGE